MKTKSEKEIIKAIHYREVKDFLDAILKNEKLKSSIVCHNCGVNITPMNFRAIVKKSENLIFCCDNQDCYMKFVEKIRK